MSKGNMLLGYSRGKVGSLVFSRSKGQQITRAYNARPNNPKSFNQQIQRARMANVVNMYRALVALCNHSFTSRPIEQSSFNAFVSANLKNSRVFLAKSQAAEMACVVAPYTISRGTLPSIQTTGSGDNVNTNINLGALVISASTTVGEFSSALIANNSNIFAGDQLSYISCVQSTNVNTGMPQVASGLYEVTLNEASTELLSDYMPSQAVVNRNGVLGHGAHVATGAYAWILSRMVDGRLDCSTQRLILNDTSVYNAYTGDVVARQAANSYDAAPEPFLVPGSINANGGGGSVAPTGNPSIAGARMNTQQLGASTPSFQITAGTNSVVISGTDLAGVEAATLTLNGSAVTGVTIADQSATSLTLSFTTAGTITLQNVAIALDGASLFSWSAYVLNPGGYDGD